MTAVSALSIESLVEELSNHPVNRNEFFHVFKDRHLTLQQLQTFIKQYHYFCHHFVKLLEGLLYKTPLEEIEMRVELAKTLYSELGSGSIDHAHIRQLQRFARCVDLDERDLQQTEPIPEVTTYQQTLHSLFLESGHLTALGAELAVETTAASEFQYFYPGLQKYNRFSRQDLVFFELHMAEEQQHSDWLIEAVRKTATTQDALDQVAAGARHTADAWAVFWDGMGRAVFEPHSLQPSPKCQTHKTQLP